MKIPKSILERRRSVRIEEKLQFRIGHRDYEIESQSINLSLHGALCLMDREIALMTQLDIAFAIPVQTKNGFRDKMIQTRGVVVRRDKDPLSDSYYIAIYFTEIKPQDQKLLESFIQYRLKS